MVRAGSRNISAGYMSSSAYLASTNQEALTHVAPSISRVQASYWGFHLDQSSEDAGVITVIEKMVPPRGSSDDS